MDDNRYNDRITGKIIICANLVNDTPLVIGKGAGDANDIEVMRLPDGRPYIPASSIAGCLKRFMCVNGLSKENDYLWGRTGKNEDNPLQSHIRIDDLVPESTHPDDITMRDGVKIDHEKGTAKDKQKYDYQLVEPGITFPFFAEITIRQSMHKIDLVCFISNLRTALNHQYFRIGAQTNTGFGKITCQDFKAYRYIFPKHAEEWFDFVDSGSIKIEALQLKESEVIDIAGSFSIEACFLLKTSLIIGAYGEKSEEPDKSHLRSRDKFVLSGKSIRGAIRHRAVRILNTLGQNAEEKINDLFGNVDEDNNKAIKGRLLIEEYVFNNDEVKPMTQDRIRIDRFTGGTINGALFNSEPIWTTGRESIKLTFTIRKDAKPEDKKLLMFLLKDLWLEDLAIGGEKNVGRGILIGQEAKIYNDGKLLVYFKRAENTPDLDFVKGTTADINALFELNQSLTS